MFAQLWFVVLTVFSSAQVHKYKWQEELFRLRRDMQADSAKNQLQQAAELKRDYQDILRRSATGMARQRDLEIDEAKSGLQAIQADEIRQAANAAVFHERMQLHHAQQEQHKQMTEKLQVISSSYQTDMDVLRAKYFQLQQDYKSKEVALAASHAAALRFQQDAAEKDRMLQCHSQMTMVAQSISRIGQ